MSTMLSMQVKVSDYHRRHMLYLRHLRTVGQIEAAKVPTNLIRVVRKSDAKSLALKVDRVEKLEAEVVESFKDIPIMLVPVDRIENGVAGETRVTAFLNLGPMLRNAFKGLKEAGAP